MAPGPAHSDEPKYRLVFDERAKSYHIQKKRLILPGYKMMDHIVGKTYDRGKAVAKLHALREGEKIRKTKKHYIVLED